MKRKVLVINLKDAVIGVLAAILVTALADVFGALGVAVMLFVTLVFAVRAAWHYRELSKRHALHIRALEDTQDRLSDELADYKQNVLPFRRKTL